MMPGLSLPSYEMRMIQGTLPHPKYVNEEKELYFLMEHPLHTKHFRNMVGLSPPVSENQVEALSALVGLGASNSQGEGH